MKKDINIQRISRFNPSINEGLNSIQVQSRIEQGLTNKVKKKTSKSYLNIFVGNICTFFNLLGFIVFVALLAIGSDIFDFFFVIFYVANTSVGIIQEIRAKRCIDKLSLLSDQTSKVIRNGQTLEIPSTQLVLDDIYFLGLGNQIPTDSVILEGEIEANEALLTGESVPVKKKPGDVLLAGSFIVSGVCTVRADKIGKDNYVETLSSKAKQYKKPSSEIMNSITKIIKGISFIIVPIAAAFIIKSMVIFDTNVKVAIEGSSTVVIGMIPAGMILLTSVALAVGIIKLARHNTLVQDLYSLEMLARVDTICFDKTGTITDGQMSVKEIVILDNQDDFPPEQIVSSMNASLDSQNQTAQALNKYFGSKEYIKSKQVLPFNSARKLSAVTFENNVTYAVGAPEFILDKEKYTIVEETINQYASKGYRVLLLAKSSEQLSEDYIPNDFNAIAMILIVDNVRDEAISTVKWFNENNVNIKVISGDNPITVAEVSARVGIPNADKFISLEGLSDQEVYDCANKYTVFGRVTPEQKAILVKSLKDAGHVTAMTGDGVNDILALKEADCAISVATGSDAARSVSHLVLMDNNFNSMPKVVYEGRRVINNVQSSASLFLMKTFFTMLFGIITLCMPHMNTYPFRLPQMIMLEVFVIGLPAFFLSLQPNDALVEGKFISHVIKKSVPAALTMTLGVLAVEIIKLTTNLPYSSELLYTTMAVFVLTIAGCVSLFSTCRPFNKYRTILFLANVAVVAIIIITAIFGIGILPEENLMAMNPLSHYWKHVLIVLALSIICVPIHWGLKKLCEKLNLK